MNGDISYMELTRAYRFRIYPDEKKQQLLNEEIWLSHIFYNKLLERTIKEYANDKSKISRKVFNGYMKDIMQEDKRFLKIYSQTRQDIRDRLIKAYQNFFKRVQRRKKGEKIRSAFHVTAHLTNINHSHTHRITVHSI